MAGISREQSQYIQTTALELIDAPKIDNMQDTARKQALINLAKNLQDKTGCTYETARRHIAQAIRKKRHPKYTGPGGYTAAGWGGSREGAGRPNHAVEIREGNKVAVYRAECFIGSGTVVNIERENVSVQLDGHDDQILITVGHSDLQED